MESSGNQEERTGRRLHLALLWTDVLAITEMADLVTLIFHRVSVHPSSQKRQEKDFLKHRKVNRKYTYSAFSGSDLVSSFSSFSSFAFCSLNRSIREKRAGLHITSELI